MLLRHFSANAAHNAPDLGHDVLVVRRVDRGRGESAIIFRRFNRAIMLGRSACQADSHRLQLSDTTGVRSATVSLKVSEGVFEHDRAVISSEAVRQAVEDMGFDASIISTVPLEGAKGWRLMLIKIYYF